MTFPVYFQILGHPILAHQVMETLGYAVGGQVYWLTRRRRKNPLPLETSLWIICALLAGALVGSKLLALVESIQDYWPQRFDLATWTAGKTIVGGLAGGWIAVEIAKKFLRVRRSTGDLFVFPLVAGIAVGRVGCFLEGLPDHTFGNPTGLPWGVDFGDGIPRHPTQLYEIAFVLLLGVALLIRRRRPMPDGRSFQLFMLGYFSWRFAVEFIKPRMTFLGLSPIQITCFIGALCCCYLLYVKDAVVPAEPQGAVATISALNAR